MRTVTTTEFQNNFGKYLQYVQTGKDVIILKNGKEVAKLVSYEKNISFLSDSLVGVLKNDYDYKNIKEEKNKKYEGIHWYKCYFRRFV